MYVEDYKDGAYWADYLAHPEYIKETLAALIDDAIDVGIYVFVDWHIHNDPNNFTDDAIIHLFYLEIPIGR